MDNDSGALILLIVLIVSAFLLIVIKLAQFVNRFNREKQCLLTEMNRAAESKSSGPQWGGELRKHFSKERCSQTAMPFFAVFPLYFGLFLSPVQNQMHR